jgi:hypothetical protein
MSHQLYRILRPDEVTQKGDEYIGIHGQRDLERCPASVGIPVVRAIVLRPVPSGWRKWDEVKPTEADADDNKNVYFVYSGKEAQTYGYHKWHDSNWAGCTDIHWHPLPKLPVLKKGAPEPESEQSPAPDKLQELKLVMDAISANDALDDLHYDDGDVFLNCNDAFYWGCSDCEVITAADIPEFERAHRDSKEYEGTLLFIARKRGERPQGAVYSRIHPDEWALFDACGPPREKSISNPVGTEDRVAYAERKKKDNRENMPTVLMAKIAALELELAGKPVKPEPLDERARFLKWYQSFCALVTHCQKDQEVCENAMFAAWQAATSQKV